MLGSACKFELSGTASRRALGTTEQVGSLGPFGIVHLDLHPTYEIVKSAALKVSWRPRNGGHDDGHR
jgi:hypothetical protein